MSVLEQMLSRHDLSDDQARHLAFREVMQEIALAGLQRGGFFDQAAFYGGTCLRIFHGLPRFSEGLDFSLLAPSAEFSLEPYFRALQDEFSALGVEVSIAAKKKVNDSAQSRAFRRQGNAEW